MGKFFPNFILSEIEPEIKKKIMFTPTQIIEMGYKLDFIYFGPLDQNENFSLKVFQEMYIFRYIAD